MLWRVFFVCDGAQSCRTKKYFLLFGFCVHFYVFLCPLEIVCVCFQACLCARFHVLVPALFFLHNWMFVCVDVPSCVPTICACFCLFYSVCFQCFLVVTVTQYPSVLLGATTDSKVSFVLWWLLYKSKCTHSVSESSSLFIVLCESGAGWSLNSLSLLRPRPCFKKMHNKLGLAKQNLRWWHFWGNVNLS